MALVTFLSAAEAAATLRPYWRCIVKRLIISLGLALSLVGASAYAHDAYDDSQAHPLQLAAYAVAPAGFAAEWLVTRPIHFLVSQPSLERIFNHRPHESPWDGYEAYEPEQR